MNRRISILAVMAGVLVATGGTAVAAGELITRGDQIAPDVVDGGHIKSHSIARTDQQHATLRLRVRADGGLFGDPGDGTAERIGFGNYFVRFNHAAIADPVAAPKNPRWLDDCAVVATPRVGGISSVGTGQDVTAVHDARRESRHRARRDGEAGLRAQASGAGRRSVRPGGDLLTVTPRARRLTRPHRQHRVERVGLVGALVGPVAQHPREAQRHAARVARAASARRRRRSRPRARGGRGRPSRRARPRARAGARSAT